MIHSIDPRQQLDTATVRTALICANPVCTCDLSMRTWRPRFPRKT